MSEASNPRVARRRVVRALLSVALVIAVSGAWAAYELERNPEIELLAPKVIQRAALAPGEVSLILGGDFAPADAAMPLIEQHGYGYPFAATRTLLQAADIAFANLEAPVTAQHAPHHYLNKYNYRVEPRAVPALLAAGLDLVSVANNHSFDHGPNGLIDTLNILRQGGIEPVGAGRNEAEARRAVIVEVNGIRVGFVAYLENQWHFNLYSRTFAIGNRTGCAQLNRADAARDIQRLRAAADYVIVSVHWGKNYAGITRDQEQFGAWLIQQGADLVAGHHPHIAQAVARHRQGIVLYSLGNYAWGAPGRGDLKLGLLAQLKIQKPPAKPATLHSFSLLPLVTQNRIINYQPRRLTANEAEWLTPLVEDSAKRGMRLKLQVDATGPLLVAN